MSLIDPRLDRAKRSDEAPAEGPAEGGGQPGAAGPTHGLRSHSHATVQLRHCPASVSLSSHPTLHLHGGLPQGDRGPADHLRASIGLSHSPSSRLVTPSSSMEFEAARRRLLEVEERQKVIREMEKRLEELREVFVRSEQEVVIHGEIVSRITSSAQQGELYVAENTQRLKKGLKYKKHRPTIVFSSMLGLRTCLPWPVKLK
ncbi:hypothetical protein WMY93_016597 [Mugilogobius chulae]|uniref:t-SNARE coiled-coil homology domain-containing protein n=1 Tax=Mugilogobius chulae TaxID=88201 RepID=A0AAW0NKR1_9GOBI